MQQVVAVDLKQDDQDRAADFCLKTSLICLYFICSIHAASTGEEMKVGLMVTGPSAADFCSKRSLKVLNLSGNILQIPWLSSLQHKAAERRAERAQCGAA